MRRSCLGLPECWGQAGASTPGSKTVPFSGSGATPAVTHLHLQLLIHSEPRPRLRRHSQSGKEPGCHQGGCGWRAQHGGTLRAGAGASPRPRTPRPWRMMGTPRHTGARVGLPPWPPLAGTSGAQGGEEQSGACRVLRLPRNHASTFCGADADSPQGRRPRQEEAGTGSPRPACLLSPGCRRDKGQKGLHPGIEPGCPVVGPV